MNADPASSRKLVYTLLITVAAAGVAGRIIATERVLEPSLHKAQPKDDKGRVWLAIADPQKPESTLYVLDRNK